MTGYHQLNPLIRIKEGTLLSPQMMTELVAATDFEQLENRLQSTVYGQYIDADFRNHFESDLDQEWAFVIRELVDVVPDQRILQLAMLPELFHNLKVLTKEKLTGRSYHDLLMDAVFYSHEQLETAIQTGHSEHLPAKIVETIQAVRDYAQQSVIRPGSDIIYDRRFLHEQRRLAEVIQVPALTAAVVTTIDMTNITMAARCLLQERSRSFMTAVLVSVGSIPKETFLSFARQPFAAYIVFLKQSPYNDLLIPLIEGETIDYAALAKLQDALVTQNFEQVRIDALGPLPLLAYLNNKRLEIQNLRLLLVGKRSGFTEAQIMERMRLYGT